MYVTVVDCGIGNIRSVCRMLEAVGGRCTIARTPEALTAAQRVIIPGVGAFDAGMRLLEEGGWIGVLKDIGHEEKPMLGICLGMQLFCRGSEEGVLPGLGLVNAAVRLVDRGGEGSLKLPHMGWRITKPLRDNSLLPPSAEEQRFYYAHKYRVVCASADDVIATACYGTEFTAAIQVGNVFGVQFHPEKSHVFGKALMKRFLQLPC